MLEQGQKLVPSWDTDLHLRLKQLDSELGERQREKQENYHVIVQHHCYEYEGHHLLDFEKLTILMLPKILNLTSLTD